MRSLKIRWCNSAALCLSPMALRMCSQGMLSFYLGITIAQTVCIEEHRRIGFRHKDVTHSFLFHEIEISFWCQELSLPNHLKFYRKWLAGAAQVCALQ